MTHVMLILGVLLTCLATAQDEAQGQAQAQSQTQTQTQTQARDQARSQAQAQAWSMDRGHTSVTFTTTRSFVTVPGIFERFEGVVRFDPERPEEGSIEVAIDTASINTHVDKRDAHLRSADFFDVERHPRMTFKSDRIERTGLYRYAAHGSLTIKDVTREVLLPFACRPPMPDPMLPKRTWMACEGKLTVNMLDYHVSDGKFLRQNVLDAPVDIRLNVALTSP